ncbi:MAG: hypothetical protein H7175_10165 [Burkholderiales bacterium]|nr:hypothetical protein [Anaerolineae bacterium]
MRLKSLVSVLVIIMMLMSAVVVSADGDFRINLVAPLGGTAIYCVDSLGFATDRYGNNGGISVQHLGEVTFTVSQNTIDTVGIPAQNTLLGEGSNIYGPIALYRLTSGEFQVNGNDETGKLFEFIFTASPTKCDQVGLIGHDRSSCPGRDCDGDGQIGN